MEKIKVSNARSLFTAIDDVLVDLEIEAWPETLEVIQLKDEKGKWIAEMLSLPSGNC